VVFAGKDRGSELGSAAARDGTKDSLAGQAGPLVVPAVVRATRVLETLLDMRAGATSTELALRCELAKSTTSNLLRTMVGEGLVSFDAETRHYNLGPLLVEFGIAAVSRTTAVTEARPFMEELAKQTELACLAIQRMPDGHFTAIAKIESRKDIKVTVEVGARFHSQAPLLSRMSAAWGGATARGSMTAEAREAIRTRGYAAVFGEYRPELNVMGFPVFDGDELPALYVTLLGIGDDLTRAGVDELATYLVAAAREITIRSGGKLPADYPLGVAAASPSTAPATGSKTGSPFPPNPAPTWHDQHAGNQHMRSYANLRVG
jgi:Transcriptional regulator